MNDQRPISPRARRPTTWGCRRARSTATGSRARGRYFTASAGGCATPAPTRRLGEGEAPRLHRRRRHGARRGAAVSRAERARRGGPGAAASGLAALCAAAFVLGTGVAFASSDTTFAGPLDTVSDMVSGTGGQLAAALAVGAALVGSVLQLQRHAAHGRGRGRGRGRRRHRNRDRARRHGDRVMNDVARATPFRAGSTTPERWLFWTVDEAAALMGPALLGLAANHFVPGLVAGVGGCCSCAASSAAAGRTSRATRCTGSCRTSH